MLILVELFSLGMGGKLDMETFLDAGPLTTPGFNPEVDLLDFELWEVEDARFGDFAWFSFNSLAFDLLKESLRPSSGFRV